LNNGNFVWVESMPPFNFRGADGGVLYSACCAYTIVLGYFLKRSPLITSTRLALLARGLCVPSLPSHSFIFFMSSFNSLSCSGSFSSSGKRLSFILQNCLK